MKINYFKPSHLDAHTIDEIWNFYSQHIRFADQSLWRKFLFDSDEIFIVRDRNNCIQGCGTLSHHVVRWKKRRYGILYTGITAYHPEFRGKNLTQKIGFRSFLRFKFKNLFLPTYWLFFSGTYKSYLLLSRNFYEFWPRKNAYFPEREKHLIQDLMQNRFHQDWNSETGVLYGQRQLSFSEGSNPTHIPAGDANVDFFRKQNPGVDQGDALICIAPLSLFNWAKIVGRCL